MDDSVWWEGPTLILISRADVQTKARKAPWLLALKTSLSFPSKCVSLKFNLLSDENSSRVAWCYSHLATSRLIPISLYSNFLPRCIGCIFPLGQSHCSFVQCDSVQFRPVQFSCVQFCSVQYHYKQFCLLHISFVQFRSVQFSVVKLYTVKFCAVLSSSTRVDHELQKPSAIQLRVR